MACNYLPITAPVLTVDPYNPPKRKAHVYTYSTVLHSFSLILKTLGNTAEPAYSKVYLSLIQEWKGILQ